MNEASGMSWVAEEQYTLLKELARSEWSRLRDDVIHYLKELPEDCRQSGDDSQFFDVWDEYKHQIQFEESVSFEAYTMTIEQYCRGLVHELAPSSKGLLWVFSDGYYDWEFEEGVKIQIPVGDPVDTFLVSNLLELVNETAADEEIVTVNERLLDIAPWADSVISWLNDPGYFVSTVFEAASDYVCARPETDVETAKGIAVDLITEMESDGAPTYELGSNDEDRFEAVVESLVKFLGDWRTLARKSMGERLDL